MTAPGPNDPWDASPADPSAWSTHPPNPQSAPPGGGYPPPGTAYPGYPANPYQGGYPGGPGPGYLPGGSPYPMPPNPYAAPRNGMGTAALVLGILSVVFVWVPYVGIILGILAIIFGGVGIARANRREATNKGSAVAGLVLGIIGVAGWIILILVFAAAFATFATA